MVIVKMIPVSCVTPKVWKYGFPYKLIFTRENFRSSVRITEEGQSTL